MLKKIILTSFIFMGALVTMVEGANAEGGISVESPWVRSMAGAKNTGAYCTITNNKPDQLDQLIGADCPEAAAVELHNHIDEDGIMKMRPVPFIEIGAKAVSLKPGSLHIMLMGLKDSFQDKEFIPLTLHFKNAGKILVNFPVKKYE